jgi:hypothetical protein
LVFGVLFWIGFFFAFSSASHAQSFQPGSIHPRNGDSFYTTASHINMLRSVQNDCRDHALGQLEREYPGLSDALRADK